MGVGISIIFLPQNKVVQASHGESLLETALRAELPLSHSCGGNGTCGTCRVIVEKGLDKLPPRNEIELEMAQDRQFKPEERLCCQVQPEHEVVVRIP